MSYAGMVVGGPWAGKMYEGRAARVEVHVAPHYAEIPTGKKTEHVSIPTERMAYVFTEMFGVRLWVPSGWSQDDIAREVFTNYRPQAMREVTTTAF
jgi:hypothetical protein